MLFWILLPLGCNGSLNATGIINKTRCDRGWTANSLCPRWWAMVFSATSNSHQANPWNIVGNHLSYQTSHRDVPGWLKECLHVYITGVFSRNVWLPYILRRSQIDESSWCQLRPFNWSELGTIANHTKSNQKWTSFNLKRLHLQLLLVFTSVVSAASWIWLTQRVFVSPLSCNNSDCRFLILNVPKRMNSNEQHDPIHIIYCVPMYASHIAHLTQQLSILQSSMWQAAGRLAPMQRKGYT